VDAERADISTNDSSAGLLQSLLNDPP